MYADLFELKSINLTYCSTRVGVGYLSLQQKRNGTWINCFFRKMNRVPN
ncbi:25439_t:CDS:2, partial [Gigaspora rosea]